MAKFVKGQSGNPSGRAKTTALTREFREMAREYTDEALNAVVAILRNRKAAPSTRMAAAEMLIEHGHGKAIARSEVSVTKREVKELDDATLHAIASGAGAAEAESGPDESD
jgi:hypothetical protein